MTAKAARGRADGRGILGVEGRRAAIKMKIGAAFEEPDATVPAENTVVVAGGADFFRFGEAAHGFFDERQEGVRSEEHTSELQSQSKIVCRLFLLKKKKKEIIH